MFFYWQLADRTNIDLKDKYRNIQLSINSKLSFLPPDQQQQLEPMQEGEQFQGQLDVQYEVQLGDQGGVEGEEGAQMEVPMVIPVTVKSSPRHKDGDVPWTEEEKQACVTGCYDISFRI